jgi:hypothetical protein
MLINGEVHSWRGIGRIVGLLTVLFAALGPANWAVADAELDRTWDASTVAASGDAALAAVAAVADSRGGGGSSEMGVPSTLGQC